CGAALRLLARAWTISARRTLRAVGLDALVVALAWGGAAGAGLGAVHTRVGVSAAGAGRVDRRDDYRRTISARGKLFGLARVGALGDDPRRSCRRPGRPACIRTSAGAAIGSPHRIDEAASAPDRNLSRDLAGWMAQLLPPRL